MVSFFHRESFRAGWTPLLFAAFHGHVHCVALLLAAGADDTLATLDTGATALQTIFRGYNYQNQGKLWSMVTCCCGLVRATFNLNVVPNGPLFGILGGCKLLQNPHELETSYHDRFKLPKP